jgi:hypothetical protein
VCGARARVMVGRIVFIVCDGEVCVCDGIYLVVRV